ncbi:hypothetical protein LAZ67_7000834 [Cordylochernes scorpioides]|uniref:Maturase n=1 Tax=Cordylochernes scorpioides TaxID=51811 RepID=A0ABY6KRS7_9ARAC|nr:hypothetical protein LAZ67_7000834 [Cordylochernes scorpioides]
MKSLNRRFYHIMEDLIVKELRKLFVDLRKQNCESYHDGGGLAFLIKNLYYEDIAVNISNTLDLEAQGIKVYLSQNKTINIYNITKTKTSSIKKNSGTSKRLIGYLSKTPLLKQLQFQYQELAYALENTDLNKTPGPDGIHGRIISNLGKIGKERLLNIFNNSWKTGKLLQDCKNATIIPI